MGIYLNGTTAYSLYKSEVESPYFVDKSQMLEELFPLVRGNQHICITRPRRFRGKIGEAVNYTGRILAVGISYNKARKKHSCKIEVLEA